MHSQQSVVDLFKQIAGNQFGFFGRLQSITDIVDSEVPKASCDENFGNLVGRKDVRSVGSQAIFDPEDGELIGVLKHSTILRCYPRHLNTLSEKDDDARILSTNLSSLVTRPAPHLNPSAKPLDALEVFLNQDCDCLFIYEDPKNIMGVVTPKDVIKTMAVYYQIYSQVKPLQRLRLIDLDEMQLDEIFYRGAQTARDIMRTLPILDGGEPVLAAIKAMHDHQSTVVGLLDKKEVVSQVISLDDVLVAMATPTDLRVFSQVTESAEEELVVPGTKLDLVPWEEMCESKDPVLREQCNEIASPKTSNLEPTTRVQEVLGHLLTGHNDHVLLIKNGETLEGAITLRELLRIFKTLLRIQNWEN